jgi:hypothetical protein
MAPNMKMLRLGGMVEITSPSRTQLSIDTSAAVNFPPDAEWGRTASVGTATKFMSG